MSFGVFRQQHSPVLADFGSSGVKLLQASLGDKPSAIAAAFIPFSDEIRSQPIEDRFTYLANELPRVLSEGGFRGNRVVLSPFSQHMLVQHIGVAAADAPRANEVVRTQIAIALGCDPAALVVRTHEVCETNRDGQAKVEHIAFAMSREDVMRYVSLFKRAKFTVVGVHGEISALIHAFDHVNRRIEDATTSTMYVDLGYSGTKVAICHGAQIVFAKSIAIAGRTFDARIAEARGVTLEVARAARLAEGVRPIRTAAAAVRATVSTDSGMAMLRVAEDRRSGGETPALSALPSTQACTIASEAAETLDSLCDELSMCTRYHSALFRDRRIDRVVFLGGEARDVGLCQALAGSLRLPAKVGDPLARLRAHGPTPVGLPDQNATHPGWAAACGLASSPTDL
jgi:Tfp pilus assembly PilM family ATPase